MQGAMFRGNLIPMNNTILLAMRARVFGGAMPVKQSHLPAHSDDGHRKKKESFKKRRRDNIAAHSTHISASP